MRPVRRHALWLFAFPALVRADEPRILHEFVPADPAESAGVIGSGGTQRNPAAIRSGPEVLSAPEPESPLGPPLLPPPRIDVFRPDDQTHLDGELGYVEPFNPATAPFKRVSAFDSIGADLALRVRDRRLREVPVLGAAAATPDRDLFWGTVEVLLERGAAVPIPSVSADARILSYETHPAVSLTFLTDSADNMFVRGNARGRVRLVFLTDAPAGYFGSAPPSSRSSLEEEGHPVPPALRPSVARVAAELGLQRSSPLDRILSRLTSHFRGFTESGIPPSGRSNLYEDLALGGKGVCRHRAYAFMVTANGLGIPTRFVTNEAHAFVEVELASGWLRIDLGGAAEGISISGAEGRRRHEPRTPDAFPQPPSYRDQYSNLRGPGVSGAPGPALGQGAHHFGPGTGSSAALEIPQPGAPEPPDPSAPTSAAQTDDRLATETFVVGESERPIRGEAYRVQGWVREEGGAPFAGAHVQVFLSQDGRNMSRWLGTFVCGADGRWAGEVLLPQELEPGRYFVIAIAPGDERHAPSMSAP